MSQPELEIFRLCKKLAELLGDSEAVANLKTLQERHPEMFENKEAVKNLIERAVAEPEIIVDATHSNKDIGIYKAARRLDDEKMGDVVIKNKGEINEIFHANKKNVKEFFRLEKQVETGGRVAHFLHPDIKSAWAGANAHSPAKETIPQTHGDNEQVKGLGDVGIQNDDGVNETLHANYKNIRRLEVIRKQMSVEASSAKAAPTRSDHYADEPDSSPRCDKALSTSATATIPQIQSKNKTKKKKEAKKNRFGKLTLFATT